MEFNRIDYPKFNSASINIKNAIFEVKNGRICKIQNGSYDRRTLPIILSKEQVEEVKDIQDEVNDYLESEELDKITIVYGNKIYPKIEFSEVETPSEPIIIKLKSVFVKGNKLYPQLWVCS